MTFPDTSFLCSLYRRQVHSSRAIAFMAKHAAPLPVSTLLLLEFRQSIRLQIRLHHQDMSKGFAKQEGIQMLRDLQSDLVARVIEIVPVDWSAVHQLAEGLSAGYTEAHGHRFADILHVATALQLGAAKFLTFDAKQKQLAEAEGMTVVV